MEKTINYMKQMEESVCKISIDKKVCGMAFIVSGNFLLSAGHIFANLNSNQLITAEFLDGTQASLNLLHYRYDKNHLIDYAILNMESNFSKNKGLPMAFPKNITGKFIALGNGKILPGFSNSQGEITGLYLKSEDEFMIKLSSKEQGQEGFSGAPIFSIACGAVIGIQSEMTIKDSGAERDTSLAFPLYRLKDDVIAMQYICQRPKIKLSSFVEDYLLPIFGRSLLRLGHSDNLDAYMRCIVVKLDPEQDIRFTVLAAKTSKDTFSAFIREHYNTRKLHYGVIGGMLKANVPIIYDFENDICYQLDLGGTSSVCTILNKKTKGIREKRIALLVAPIRKADGEIIGVLSFDFFPVQNKEKDITEIVKNDKTELARILYCAELYAETLSQLLLCNMEQDIEFEHLLPK